MSSHRLLAIGTAFTMVALIGCQDDSRNLAISTIKSASKLTTTQVTLSKMIFATQEKRFLRLLKLNESMFAARTQAFVKAGIDLELIGKDDVQVKGTTITVNLPPVQVIDFAYPFDKYEIDYSITHNAFANSISIEDHERLYRESELEIRRLLPLIGIKEATERNTRQLMERLLKAIGYEEIYITFKPGEFVEIVPLTKDELASQ